ncbi:MAG: serine hydrolase, partial [Bacteroidota bacterium]
MKQFILSSLFFVLSLNLSAQIAPDNPLFIELQKLDSLFFEKGFNQCDLAYLESQVAPQLNFYHDEIGRQDRVGFFESMKTNICGNPDLKPIRKLEPNSLAVFPLYDHGELYAAILKGIHHFYIREKGKEDKWTSRAKFNMVWKKEGNTWKLVEVLSYDHQDQTFNPASAKRPDLETILKNAKIPALGLGIIKNGKLTQVKVYGTLDQQRIAPYNTIFKVASLTKPIFAITVLKLIDSQQLDLDDPLYKYWIDPDLKQDKRQQQLTPRLVLTHQTGLPNWRYLTDDNKLSFQFEPGTKYQYSGEGFEYLRKAIENKLGKPIEEIAQELIFDRVGMEDTRF